MSTLQHARTMSPQWGSARRQAWPAKQITPAPSQSHTVLQRVHTPVQLEFQFRRIDTTRAPVSTPGRSLPVAQTD